MTSLEDVYNEWQNNYKFREAYKKNPEQALKNAGFELSAQDLSKVKSILKNSDDEKLDERINK